MDICIITSTFLPYIGGIGNVSYLQALGLSRLGHNVTIITPYYNSVIRDLNQHNLIVRYIKPIFKWGLAGLISPAHLVKPKKFDRYLLHIPSIGISEAMLFFNRKNNIRFSIFYHMDLKGDKFFKKSIFWIHMNFVVLPLIRKSEKVAVSSWDYLNNSKLKRYYNSNADKIICIPCPVNTDIFKLIPGKYNSKLPKKFLFVGALDRAHYFKGLDNLLKAFSYLTDTSMYELRVVGGGAMKEYYMNKSMQYGLKNKVKFLGSINNEELNLEYNKAHCLVLPSTDKSEAFGLVLIESMCCGTPVITTNLPGVRTVASLSKFNQIIKPNSVEELYRSLEISLKIDKEIISNEISGKVQNLYSINAVCTELAKWLTG